MKATPQALQKVIEGTPAERTYLCSLSFELFFSYYFLDYIKYPFAPFHFDMFGDVDDLFDDKIREIAWIAFRESAKTSLAKGLILWLITYKKRNYLNVDSFDKENAERILFDVVVEMQSNQKYIADFGQIYNTKRDADQVTQKRINNFLTNNGVRVEAHSTGESVRGRIHGHQRPDFLLLDDFETNKTKDSEAITKAVIAHIDEFKGGLDATAKVVYLGNYITEHGSINSLLVRSKSDDKLRVRMIPVEKDGKPTWDAKYVMTDVEAQATGKISLEDKKKQLGSMVYSAEMLNQPIDEFTQKFFTKFFKIKTRGFVEGIKTRKFVLIDTALSKNAKSDNTGIAKIYVDEDNNWYVSARRYQINPKTLIDLLFQFHEEGFEKIGIEKTAYTEAIEPFFQDEMKVRNKYPYIVQLSHGGTQKETRIEGLIPKYESGQIYHIEGECEDLEKEALRFPKADHDDVIDALAYGLKICEPPYKIDYKVLMKEEDPRYDDIGI